MKRCVLGGVGGVSVVLMTACVSAGPPTATETLAKVGAATGWDHLKETAPNGVRLSGETIFLGVKESATLMFDHRGSFLLDQQGKVPFAQAIGGAGPWMLDLGGEYRGLVLGEAEEVRIISEALSGRWIRPDSAFAFTVDAEKSTDAEVWLACAFKEGAHATTGRVRIDTATWKPVEWTISAGRETQTMTFHGSVALGEAWFPAEVSMAGVGGSQTLTFTQASEAPTFIRSPYEPPRPIGSRPVDVRFDASAPALLESKRAKTGHALVKVIVDGRPGWFIFDTGAGMTVIDSAFADAAKLEPFAEVQAVGVGGAVASSFVRARSLTAGAATMTDPLMTRLDLSKIAAAMGEQIDGVLGYNLMHRAIVKLSTADGKVELFDPATFNETNITWHKLAIYERHACVEGAFEDHRGWFKLDTGAGMLPVSMHAPTVRALKLLDGRETTDSKAGGVGGNVKVKAGKLAWLEIGGRREENVDATFAIEDKGAFGDPFTFGNLSPKQIGPRDLIFDYAAGRIAYPARP